MPTFLTQQDIVTGFRNLGLPRGDAVEVHSLRSMGYVQGGASTVIQALMEVVGEEGAVVMSAYPISLPLPLTEDEKARGINAKVRFLDADDDSKTGMGIIPDTFKKWPGTVLGKGLHRVCAWGKDAHLHSQGYSYLLSVNGWVLLIGVDIHRCSSMHQAESRIDWPEAITAHFRTPEAILRDYPEDRWYISYHDPAKSPEEDAWGKIQEEAEAHGLVRRGKIGEADCMLFRARPVVDLYEDHLRRDPFKLFGVDRPG
jgi:aminoglycoside 3-N-acetyltransferase